MGMLTKVLVVDNEQLVLDSTVEYLNLIKTNNNCDIDGFLVQGDDESDNRQELFKKIEALLGNSNVGIIHILMDTRVRGYEEYESGTQWDGRYHLMSGIALANDVLRHFQGQSDHIDIIFMSHTSPANYTPYHSHKKVEIADYKGIHNEPLWSGRKPQWIYKIVNDDGNVCNMRKNDEDPWLSEIYAELLGLTAQEKDGKQRKLVLQVDSSATSLNS